MTAQIRVHKALNWERYALLCNVLNQDVENGLFYFRRTVRITKCFSPQLGLDNSDKIKT
jgi:hypothetical protein